MQVCVTFELRVISVSKNLLILTHWSLLQDSLGGKSKIVMIEQVLEGLERALITMKKAEQVVVTISSEYLHDQNALQRNNATNRSFYYEVELVDFVKAEDVVGSLLKIRLQQVLMGLLCIFIKETLEAIDNLSPKKAVEMLKNLEVLKERIQRKVSPLESSKEGVVACDETEGNQNALMKKGIEATSGVPKQPSVWEKFDISKLRNADVAVALANDGGVQSCSEGTVVGASVSSSDAKSGGSTGVNEADHGADCQVAETGIPKDSGWTTVITRSKAQIRINVLRKSSQSVWQAEIDGHAQFRVLAKLKLLKEPLRELNRRDFSMIDFREQELRRELDEIQSRLRDYPLDVSLQKEGQMSSQECSDFDGCTP
ncbi:hypothetical protein RIF29_20919 [Crotalaria pallida]|uniref:Rotamase n=1 Tax=Crotalaria pallida TaxID=3830 RepID=A0AAN9I7X5_CROPI